jgi:hypothetical protein
VEYVEENDHTNKKKTSTYKILFNLDKKGHILLIGTINFDMEDTLAFLNLDKME